MGKEKFLENSYDLIVNRFSFRMNRFLSSSTFSPAVAPNVLLLSFFAVSLFPDPPILKVKHETENTHSSLSAVRHDRAKGVREMWEKEFVCETRRAKYTHTQQDLSRYVKEVISEIPIFWSESGVCLTPHVHTRVYRDKQQANTVQLLCRDERTGWEKEEKRRQGEESESVTAIVWKKQSCWVYSHVLRCILLYFSWPFYL